MPTPTPYVLTFNFNPPLPATTAAPLLVEAATPSELAQEVHRHARGILRARTVDIRLDPQELTGTVVRAHSTAAVFALEPASPARGQLPSPGHAQTAGALRGYTIEQLHHLARKVVHADRWHTAADIEDRYDAAWHAIVEHLLTADQPPTRHDLFNAGLRGSDRAVLQSQQAHGYNRHQPGTGTRPRFERYWATTAAPTPSPEDTVVERRALAQIWPQLTPRQQDALNALAATGDYHRAAAMLGVTPGTFNVHLSHARRRFLALWHEGEQPSRPWGTDRRVGSRTETAPAVTKRRPPTRAVTRRTGRPQHELVHGQASTYTNHACRCPPCTSAATDQARERNRANGAAPRRRITVSQLADIRRRQKAGEAVTAIAAELGFSDTYLYRLLAGTRQPAPDPA